MLRIKGFTVIELAVVLGILTTILGIAAINLTTIQHKTYLATTVDTVIADIKKQQLKAMIGDSEGRSSHDRYGVYFESDRYTLFHGLNYSPSDLANKVVPLDNSIIFGTISFPQNKIVFEGVSGEINNYASGSDKFILKNSVTNEQRTITFNRYGVIISVN